MEVDRAATIRYLRLKLQDIEYKLTGRRIGERGREYGQPAILELINQLDGSVRLAYAQGIFKMGKMGDDAYKELVSAIIRFKIQLKEKV